ncbi:hypothetical protein B6U93_01460 [Candidatus Woesearchaeota archaeon ex4484_78]|nr:MAG: hypothetical protein B6U93_01460 [Candidatus Woesearchaeota archaeon ex4484_78]
MSRRRVRKGTKTTALSIFLVIICTIFTSFGQLFYKLSFIHSNNLLIKVIFSPYLYIGLLLYFIGALLLIVALRSGELSTLYPFIALGFIWVSLFSIWFLKENFTTLKWIGIFSIMIGLSFVGFGSR